jgi:GDPmannose 4,6-dehydratase
MLQQERPGDYVVATGETHRVREFVELAFGEAGISIDWDGEGLNETGRNRADGKVLVRVNEAFYRPAEVDLLIGDPAKANAELGWTPNVGFSELVSMMVRSDLDSMK